MGSSNYYNIIWKEGTCPDNASQVAEGYLTSSSLADKVQGYQISQNYVSGYSPMKWISGYGSEEIEYSGVWDVSSTDPPVTQVKFSYVVI